MDASNIGLFTALSDPLRRLLELLDHWAFAKLDRQARSQGWQVHRPAPLMRVYRNPRFDTLTPCAACDGEGVTARGACRICLGSGRVRT